MRIVWLIAGLALLGVGVLYLIAGSHLDLFTQPAKLRQLVSDSGSLAPYFYVVIQALQVVLAPIPGEITGAAAGWLFGGLAGAVYASVGLGLGSATAFLLGRACGRPLIVRLVGERALHKLDFLSGRQGPLILVAVFVIPGFPKDVATYVYALSDVRFVPFFALSQLGRLPGTVMLTYSADALVTGDWVSLAILGVVSIAMIGLAYWQKDRIQSWMRGEEGALPEERSLDK